MDCNASALTVRASARVWLTSFEHADFIATMQMPKLAQEALAGTCNGDDSALLARQLMDCFNRLDRKIFGQGHRKKAQRVKRIGVLEYAEGGGWHAHIMMQAPLGLEAKDLKAMLEKLWLKKYRKFLTKDFEGLLLWSEPQHGDYFSYITKHLDRGSELDILNLVL